MNRRNLLLAGTGLLAAPAIASAQGAWPNRPIRLIIPWPPGQATDLMARVMGQRISELLGQPVVPENRAGAGGMIGTDAVAKAAPDGYTILAASAGPITTAPLVQRTPYDVDRQLLPVAMFGLSPYVLVVRNNFPAQTAQEFVATVKANPGKFTFASSGTGAAAHLIALMFISRVGLDVVHVPFQGSSPALTAVIGGQVDFSVETMAATRPLMRQGALRGLGVSLANGSYLAPELQPLSKLVNIPGYDVGAWGGFMMPAGTPPAIAERLAAETAKATQSPEIRERFDSIAVELQPRGPAAFAAYLQEQKAKFGEVIRANNIRVDG